MRFLLYLALLSIPAMSAAESMPAPTWVEVNGVLLRYQLLGEGPVTVVLLHELSMSLEGWDELLPVILPGRRILRYDLRGFGLSERVNGPISMDDEVGDLRALLDNLEINGKVVLVGSTAGGAIALKFAAAYPGRVSGVAAFSPAAYMTPQPQRLSSDQDYKPRPAREARTEDHEELFPKKIRDAHPERLIRFRGIQYSSDPKAARESTRMLYAIGFANVLPRIQCPVVVVATSLFIRPVAEFRDLARAIPHGRLEVIETGHVAPLESPELAGPVLLKFFGELQGKQ